MNCKAKEIINNNLHEAFSDLKFFINLIHVIFKLLTHQ